MKGKSIYIDMRWQRPRGFWALPFIFYPCFAFHFLLRIRHCAGFGIQSPTDYDFCRDVVYERLPYHAYTDIDAMHPDSSWMERKLSYLLLRVINFAQADNVIFSGVITPMMKDAIKAGCSKTNIIEKRNMPKDSAEPPLITFDMYYLSISFPAEKRYPEKLTVNFY